MSVTHFVISGAKKKKKATKFQMRWKGHCYLEIHLISVGIFM